MSTSNELKRLQTRITDQTAIAKDAQDRAKKAQEESVKEWRKLVSLEKSRDALLKSAKEPVITEHALLRYCENVLGIDTEGIKTKILTDAVKEQIRILGNGKYPNGDFVVVVKGGQVVTITKKDGA